MNNEIGKLTDIHMDVLREIGNIGAGHAATALSEILDRPVDMIVPKVRLVPFDQLTDWLGGPEQKVAAVFFRVEGDLQANLFYIMHEESVDNLVRSLLPQGQGESGIQAYSDLDYSAIQEVANILAGSYLSSLADFTGLSLTLTVPALAIDMAGALLGYGVLQAGASGDLALVIDSNFVQGDRQVEGRFFFLPDPDSFRTLFNALGVHHDEGY